MSRRRNVGPVAVELRDRIWSHGINSLGRLERVKRGFAGIEMDLMFEGAPATFHLRRPSGITTGLTLEDMLVAASDRPRLGLWLDWKNAEAASFPAALERLRELDRRYGLRGRCVVETGSDALFPELRGLSVAGFVHGYYLPTATILDLLSTGSEKDAESLAREIEARVEAIGASAITLDRRLQPFVDRWLEPLVRTRRLGRYAWDLDLAASAAAEASDEMLRCLVDGRFEVLLVVLEAGSPSSAV